MVELTREGPVFRYAVLSRLLAPLSGALGATLLTSDPRLMEVAAGTFAVGIAVMLLGVPGLFYARRRSASWTARDYFGLVVLVAPEVVLGFVGALGYGAVSLAAGASFSEVVGAAGFGGWIALFGILPALAMSVAWWRLTPVTPLTLSGPDRLGAEQAAE